MNRARDIAHTLHSPNRTQLEPMASILPAFCTKRRPRLKMLPMGDHWVVSASTIFQADVLKEILAWCNDNVPSELLMLNYTEPKQHEHMRDWTVAGTLRIAFQRKQDAASFLLVYGELFAT